MNEMTDWLRMGDGRTTVLRVTRVIIDIAVV